MNLFANDEFSSAPYLQVSSASRNPIVLRFTDSPQLVEVHMPRDDAPGPLKATAGAAATMNK